MSETQGNSAKGSFGSSDGNVDSKHKDGNEKGGKSKTRGQLEAADKNEDRSQKIAAQRSCRSGAMANVTSSAASAATNAASSAPVSVTRARQY